VRSERTGTAVVELVSGTVVVLDDDEVEVATVLVVVELSASSPQAKMTNAAITQPI
jgi:hypothetical protein